MVLIGTDNSSALAALQRHAPDVPVIGDPQGDTEDRMPTAGVRRRRGTSMAAAVAGGRRLAAAGDTVLMAPAAASMDQFSSYAHRGNAFIEAVRELVEGQARPARSNNGQHAHATTPRRKPARPPPAAHSPRCPHRPPARDGDAPASRTVPAARRHAATVLAGPESWALEGTQVHGSTYYLILGSTLALTAIGIMMVLSAPAVEAIAAGESPYSAVHTEGDVRRVWASS